MTTALTLAAPSQAVTSRPMSEAAWYNPNRCHGCGTAVQGGIVTPCTTCGNWGLFCLNCSRPYTDGAASLYGTKCLANDKDGPEQDRRYFSPSQIEAFDLCIRKWAWRYVDGIKVPSNPFAQFGTRGHFQIEQYLLTGTMFDLTTPEGEAAMAGVHLLPQPGTPGMTVEQSWYMTGWDHLFHGKKDVQIDRLVPDEHGSFTPQRIPLIIDHKFVGSFRFAHTADTLPKNVQAALYAADALIKFKAPAVDLRWIYYTRIKPHKARAVDVRVYRKDLEPALSSVRESADVMALIKLSGIRAKDLPPNPAACSAFGGCPYVRHCNLSPREALIAAMQEQTGPQTPGQAPDMKSAFLQSVRDKVAAQGGNGTAVNPPPVGAVPPSGPPAWAQTPPAQLPPSGPPAQLPPSGPPAWTPPPAQTAPPQGPPAWAPNPGQQPPQGWGPPSGQPPAAQLPPSGPPAWAPPPQVQTAPPPQGPPQFSPDGAQVWIPGTAVPIPMPGDNVVRSPDGAYFWAPVGQSWAPITALGPNPSPVLNPATGAPPQVQGSAPMPPQTGGDAATAEAEKKKGGRPKGSTNKAKVDGVTVDPNADPLDLAIEGLDMVITGFVLLKQALIKITGRTQS